VHVDETMTPSEAAYDMIIGCDLITDLKLVLDFDTQCIVWDHIDVPMTHQGIYLNDLYAALLPPPPQYCTRG
jgi:hypothetical protein